MSLQEQFAQAQIDSKNLPERPDNMTLLKIYALYKQGSGGDVTGERPGFTDMVGRAKYDAWAALKGTSQDLVDVTLRARNADDSPVAVATLRAPSAHPRDLHRTVQIDVANRRWQLDLQASARDLPGAGAGLPITVTIGGALVTLLLVTLVHVMATGRDRARTAVIRATADLLEQKTLLEAIMDSVGESIVVIDDRAEFLLYNTAAAPLLEVDGVPVATNAWDQHFQRFLPDGITPYPKDQLPFARALAGESTQGMEMIICTPEGTSVTKGHMIHSPQMQLQIISIYI